MLAWNRLAGQPKSESGWPKFANVQLSPLAGAMETDHLMAPVTRSSATMDSM